MVNQLLRRCTTLSLKRGCLVCLISVAGVAASHPTYGFGGRHLISPTAHTARTINISDKAILHLKSHQGTQILNEQGYATGTLSGAISIKIALTYTQATITFSARPSGGTLSGKGVESYYVAGGNGHFQGTVTIRSGTERYAHVHATPIHLDGTIQRKQYEVFTKIWGQLHT
jgi:hypothetical protein